MDYGLLQIFAFFRPILYIDFNTQLAGFEVSEITGILLSFILIIVFLIRATTTKKIYISSIDIVIIGFVIWCTTIYIVYRDIADIRDFSKVVLPPITYIVARNVLKDKQQYLRVLGILLIGFIVPIVACAAVIMKGGGLADINYWSGVEKYRGIYTGEHNMGHNMAFYLMLMFIYFRMKNDNEDSDENIKDVLKKILFSVIGLLAVYCLYKSTIRTASIGFIIFLMIYLYHSSRKIFLGVVVTGVITVLLYLPVIIPKYFTDFEKVYEGQWGVTELGSGRLGIWLHNIDLYSELPIDKMLGGVGMGNKAGYSVVYNDIDVPAASHNDFLDMLMETGAVGFILFLALQYLIWKSIMKLDDQERYLFLAIFVAVIFMNFVSNSYVTRFGLGQMYYLLMAYIGMSEQKISSSVTDTVTVDGRTQLIEERGGNV